jgi:hypothetical protein
MASDRQIEANRINGKKGGPKTPAGRAAVRNNALKHGLSAQHPVIPIIEDQAKFDQFLDQLTQELQPEGIMETLLVNQIADSHWRRQRIIQMETGLFDVNSAELRPAIYKNFTGMTAEGLLHLLAEADAKGPDMLGRYYRYDARFERSFYRAWKELKALQGARQIEPEVIETEEPCNVTKQTETTPTPVPEIVHKTTTDLQEIKKPDRDALR